MSSIPSFNSKPKTIREYDLVPDGDYPARITRFVGLGVQEQPPFQGQAKDPAFKAMFEFELIDIDTSGTEIKNAGTDDEERTPLEPTPSCQFHDVFLFPGASRGKVFDLCKVLDPKIEKVPNTLEWFEQHLGAIVSVTVGSYVIKKGPNAGKQRNTVRGVAAIPKMFKSQVGDARREFVFFDPYVESDQAFAGFSALFPYQRTMLEEAIDTEVIVYAGLEPAKTEKGEQKSADEKPQAKNKAASGDVDFDEDLPF